LERFELDANFESLAPPAAADGPDLEESAADKSASPVVQLADRILLRALESRASDIHVEPQEESLQVRMRLDGVLQNAFEALPAKVIPALTSRFKIMADLDIAERRLPQDGRIRRRYQGRTMDFRVNVLPSRFGEKIVMRLLDSSATQLRLDQLISDPQSLADVRDMGRKPYGILLVTGPTGSGKSTTLYSLLAERNDPGINISTVEDPIEYTLPGITQTQVNRDKGLNFAQALRAFMRQDPDVLLVGETRDLETAKTALEAALTGHLVLTTLHCNDAPSAVARLEEMGVETFMLSAAMIGVLSQRLLRRLCPHCREPHKPSEAELARLGLQANDPTNVTFQRAPRQNNCSHCHGLGYRGRVGVYEVMRVNEALASAIGKGVGTDQLRRLALGNGMRTLLGYGLGLAREGITSLDEVERVLLTDSGLEQEIRARNLTTASCRGCGAGLRDEWIDCPYCLTPRGTLQPLG
jgi:type IV pilus assembly protein PilB